MYRNFIYLCTTAVLSILCTPVLQAITIAEDHQSRADIVIAKDAIVPEQFGATELASFLKQITGGEFAIVNQPQPGKDHIFVGPQATRQYAPALVPSGLGREGIFIGTPGNNLVLTGGRPRGTLYAVYTFLEDYVGCRWWSSRVSTIPQKPTLKFNNIRYTFIPPLEYRESFWSDAFDGDWAARNKCNGNSERLDARHGGKNIYQGFVHTFYSLIPPDKYFKNHPEWFSLINGKRTFDHAQLCLTNEDMRRELVKNLKQRLRNNPRATIASVSQNDWHGNCQCPKCAAIEKEEGSPAGLMIRFVNKVAQDIATDFPNVAISTLAYQYTRKPPLHARPRSNVIVRLCSIECSFSKPLSDDRNYKFRNDIVGWSKICNRLYIWDYTTNFRHYFLPHPNIRVLGPNIRFFVNHNVKGVFEQGAYTTLGADMAELRAWVLAKLLWNPDLDADKLINEFLAGYYGPAAGQIKAYLDTIHDAVEKSGDWLGCFSSDQAKFLSFDTLARGWIYLQAAEDAVFDKPDIRLRVQVAQLPVMYAFMRNWKKFHSQAVSSDIPWPLPRDFDAVYNRFMQIARAKHVTRLNEWQNGFVLLDDARKKAKQ